MRPIGTPPPTPCWHCGESIERSGEAFEVRYIHRSEQPLTVILEDWIKCTCGAYQNVRRLTEILVESLGTPAPSADTPPAG